MFVSHVFATRARFVCGLVTCLILLGLPVAQKALAQTRAVSAIGEPSSSGNQDERPRPGLVAIVRDDKHSVSFLTPTPNFYLEPGESLHPSLSAGFEATWTGFLSILRSGNYVFDAGTAEINVGGEPVSGTGVELETGRQPVTIRYQREPGAAQLRLRWKAAHFPMEPIPPARFSHAPDKAPSPENNLAEKGRSLAEDLGCVNCHRTESASLLGRQGPDLSAIASRVASRWLYHWLGDPQAFRPGSAMPRQLDPQQRRDVTSYLLSLGGGGEFEHKRMSNERGPYFGRETYSTIGCAACHEQPGLSLDGMGSKISLANLQVYLKDPLRFDPGGRMPAMMLSDEETYNLAALLTRSRNEAFEQPWEPGDAANGRRLVQSHGCLSCHGLKETAKEGGGPLENSHSAPRLEELSPDRGCLADAPSGVPIYQLSGDDRLALKAFVRAFRKNPDRTRAPIHDFSRRAQQLRCVACHETDRGSPTAPLAEKVPSLAGAGAKLRGAWMSGVLTNDKRTQTHGHLRMPQYDPSRVAGFSAAMAKVSGVSPTDAQVRPAVSANQESSGVGLLGTNSAKQGMSCIGCHGFAGKAPLGEDGPYLSHADERLRYDWFQRWMRDPARILSGTSMPNYFSSTPPQEARKTIDTLWAAFSMGDRMPLPDGFRAEDAPPDAEARPVPGSEAIVVRFYMPEATPSAIAVGLPDNVSYCFDTGEVRLRYAWLGGFVDLTGTLFEKRDSVTNLTRTVDLLGDIFYRTTEFPIRFGLPGRIPQRRYRGYRIIDGRPRFHYQVDGIDVHETVLAAEGNQGLIRQFTIARVEGPAWFLTENPEGVELTSTLGQPIDGKLEIPNGNDVRFEVTIVKQETK